MEGLRFLSQEVEGIILYITAQIGSGSHPSSYSKGTGITSWRKAAGLWSLSHPS